MRQFPTLAALAAALAGCTPSPCPAPPDYTAHMQGVALQVGRQTTTLDNVIEAVTAYAESHGQAHADHEDPNNPEGVALVALIESLDAAAAADLALVERMTRLTERLTREGLIRN